MSDGVGSDQRFTKRTQECPICGGVANAPQHKGERCFGFLSEDGEFAHCTREDKAGNLQQDNAQTYAHKLHGQCGCGDIHGEELTTLRPSHSPTSISAKARKAQIEAVTYSRDPDKEYVYNEASGAALAVKGRWNIPSSDGGKADKNIMWRVPDSKIWDGLSKHGLGMDLLPLYHADKLDKLPTGSTIYLVEGEKACDACEDSGLVDWQTSGVTTLAGGASQIKFGAALDQLQGHHVRPWADNDVPGRKLMMTVRALVEGSVLSWTPVLVSVPEGGDAHDYFFPEEGSGYEPGKVAEIEHQGMTGPVAEHVNEDTIRVTCPTLIHNCPAVFTFTELERKRRAVHTVVEVRVPKKKTLRYDIDVLSISNVNSFRLMLDKTFGETYDWTDLTTTAISRMLDAWASSTPLTDSAEIAASDDDELQYAVDRILPWGEHAILFGRRDSTKSYIALMMACCASLGLPFAGLTTKAEGPWLYLDNETNERNWVRRLRRCWRALGFTEGNYPRNKVFYKSSRGLSLPDMADEILPKIEEHGIVGIIQDSVIAALGGDPLNPQDVNRYCNAVDRISKNRTFLSIAHIPKDTLKEPDDPFGSIVLANKSRVCLRVNRSKQQPNQDLVEVCITPTKGNDIPDKRPIWLNVAFDGNKGAVSIRQTSFADVRVDINDGKALKWRIWDVLKKGAMAASEITEVLNKDSHEQVDQKTVKDTCYRQTQDGENPRFIALDQGVGGRGKEVRYGRMSSGPQRILPKAVGESQPIAVDDDLPFG